MAELMTLNEVERRVLGVLLEKSMTHAEYYPLTLNSVVTACNQKSNRNPLMDLDEPTVERTLDELRRRGMVSVVLPPPGGRTNRYRHEIAGKYGWEKRVTAVMTELLLRGPQTPGELRTRCMRFVPFEDLQAVMTVLEYLEKQDPPLAKSLPRQPGHSAIRYLHLLYPPEELESLQTQPEQAESATPAATPAAGGSGAGWREEVTQIKAEVARLSTELADLQQRFDALESELR